MIYVSAFPTWFCPNECSYCSVPEQWRESITSVLWDKWSEALNKLKDISLDFSGGEPFFYGGFAQLTGALKHRFALTTSLKAFRQCLEVAGQKNCHHITCSYHSHLWNSESEFYDRVREIGQLCSVSVSIVQGYEELDFQGFRIGVNKYDPPPAKSKKSKLCNAGRVCIAIDPKGDVYRCWGQLRAGSANLGNIFGTYKLLTGPEACNVRCPHCFESDGQYGVKVG